MFIGKTNFVIEEDEDDDSMWENLFSGHTKKVTIAVCPCSTSLWRTDQWEPVFGENFFDKLPNYGVYEITHLDFVKICNGISKKRALSQAWHPTPEKVAKACDTAGIGSRWFRMSDTFSEYIGRSKPILELDSVID